MAGWTASGYPGWTASGYPGWTASGFIGGISPPVTTAVTLLPGGQTAADYIKSSLRKLTSLQSGDPLAAPDANDCLETFNDLLDSWSNQHWAVYGSNENILSYTGGKYQYTIGNPDGGQFIGTLSQGSATITGVTAFPANLVVNGDLTAFSSLIPAGTYITDFDMFGGTVSMSQPALGNKTQDAIEYTVPGDFKIERPLRITNAFTRITTGGTGGGYDYPIDIISQDRYVEIGLKSIAYPWPTELWYNNTYPYGTISFYGAPAGGGQLHLFTDTILRNVQLNDPMVLPQGYARAFKWNLTRELALEFGFPLTKEIEMLAAESLDIIKRLNAVPVPECHTGLPSFSGGHQDAGWILYGGFRR